MRNILSDPAFHEVFPACQLSPDSAAAYRFTTTAGGEYSAVGRGGPVTGRGASLLILDDLIKDSSEANSDTVCRGIIEWLQHVAFTRLTPNGRVLAIATRWSERDPMGWILQQHGWIVLHLAALAESATDPLGREIGQALWPSHYPVEALEAIRADVGSRVFQTLYQGNVSAAQGTIFKRDWFRHFSTPPAKFTRTVQSWDTAFKTGTTNDFSVCTTWAQAENGFYLLSMWRGRAEFPELKRQVAIQAEAWRPDAIIVEDKASGQSLIQELSSATTFPVIPVKVDCDKMTRASAVTAYFEAGKVHFPEGVPWLAGFEDELAAFPGSMYDDCVDSVTQALNYLRGETGAYGVLELMKKGWDGFIDTWIAVEKDQAKMLGQPIEAPRSAQVTVEGWEKWVKEGKAPPCPRPECGSTNTILIGGRSGPVVHCNECAANDGVLPVPEEKPGHVHRWRIIPCGWERCDDCAEQRPIGNGPRPTTNGMSRAQYAARTSGFGRSYGRFGGWR